jgi:hypothetical protein
MKRIIGLLLGMSLAVALLGVGLNAALTTTGSVGQTITVNGVAISVTSSTPGAVINPDGTITCPTVAINATTQPSGTDAIGCSFTIASASGLVPSNVNVTFVSSAAAPKFTEVLTGDGVGGSAPRALPTSPVSFSNLSTLPGTINSNVSWAGLDGSDFGQSVTVTFAITATP